MRIEYDNPVGKAERKSGCVNAWQLIPINISAKRFGMPKTVVGRSQRQAAERIFSGRCGAVMAVAMAADSVFIQRRAIQKIIHGVFVAQLTAVRTEGANS
jgi:hypothetical protein